MVRVSTEFHDQAVAQMAFRVVSKRLCRFVHRNQRASPGLAEEESVVGRADVRAEHHELFSICLAQLFDGLHTERRHELAQLPTSLVNVGNFHVHDSALKDCALEERSDLVRGGM